MAFTKPAAFLLLKRAFEQQRMAHAYLIAGPAGSGKRELAADLSALLAGKAGHGADFFSGGTGSPFNHPDVHTIEPESKSRRIVIEQVRALERELQMRPTMGGGRK